MRTHTLTALTLITCGFISTAPAATVIWGTPTNISGDTDVSTTGTLDRAEYMTPNAPTTTTVNGVVFTSLQNTDTSVTTKIFGNTVISTTQDYIETSAVSTPGGTFASLSANYQTVLGYASFGYLPVGFQPITITLNGLTSGQEYLFQVWINDPREFSENL